MPFTVAFTIQSDTRYLRVLRSCIDAVAKLERKKSFSKQARLHLKLALIEAVNNAIFHAHKKQRNIPIAVKIILHQKNIFLEVGDQGSGMQAMSPVLPPLSVRGRGLMMIQNVMHEVASVTKGKKHVLQMHYALQPNQKGGR